MAEERTVTIGNVVKRLQAQYPDLSISKIRYLEDEGLLTPSRSAGGYRRYSARDIKRLERILYLQKTRFLPLAVIKDELDRGESSPVLSSAPATGSFLEQFEIDDDETASKLHPIERVPEILGVSVSFMRSLNEVGILDFKRSPAGRDLVDGKDFPLIRVCEQLRQLGIEPKILRQYVMTANRESGMFEQALTVYGRRDSALDDAERARLRAALDQMIGLTGALREVLIRRTVASSYRGIDS